MAERLGDTIGFVEGTPQSAQSGSWRSKQGCGGWVWGIVVAFALYVIADIAFGPIVGPVKKGPLSASVQAAHALGLALFSCANDNQGLYPDGTSSTEVFQKLMDGGYVTDPNLFYLPMDGKIRPSENQKTLKPENVCWDVTGGASLNDPGEVPLIFMTGFRMTYAPGGGFSSRINSYPPYADFRGAPGMAVFFINNSAHWLTGDQWSGSFSHQHVLSPDFNPHGKTYRQLTPDGVLR